MCRRNEYPRPQLKRDKWLSLCGEWQFAFGEDVSFNDAFKGELPRRINVPFSYQYPLSGIGDESYHETVYYKRAFELSAEQAKAFAVLNFNAVDYRCEVYINGNFVVSHVGGYSPFKADITKYLKRKNEIFIKCVDTLDPFVPRGKQSWRNERFGCWYVPNTGIWQSVWIDFTDG
ncbi:MAG: glycoside hydrolase family 2, partial [Clostridia bacterium]|nr:glycoside hydrolase family 2 [Clostridia bacterium]